MRELVAVLGHARVREHKVGAPAAARRAHALAQLLELLLLVAVRVLAVEAHEPARAEALSEGRRADTHASARDIPSTYMSCVLMSRSKVSWSTLIAPFGSFPAALSVNRSTASSARASRISSKCDEK